VGLYLQCEARPMRYVAAGDFAVHGMTTPSDAALCRFPSSDERMKGHSVSATTLKETDAVQSPAFLASGGEMGVRMRAFDCSSAR
jgi:hypothetical protein